MSTGDCEQPLNSKKGTKGNKPRIKWDEEKLAKQQKERGVLYGRMKIDQPDTPFLFYDAAKAEGEGIIGEYVVSQDDKREVNQVSIVDLQKRLGLLAKEQAQGKDITVSARKQEHVSSSEPHGICIAEESKRIFEAKRAEIQKDECHTLIKSRNENVHS